MNNIQLSGKTRGHVFFRLGNAAYFQSRQITQTMRPVRGSENRGSGKPGSDHGIRERRYPRNEAMARAYLSGQHTMLAIAEYFGVHYSTVSG
jgi:putative transposase